MSAAKCTHVKDHVKKVKPHTKGCEECLKIGDTLGSSAHVPGVRQGGLLRLIQEPPCHGALPRGGASDHAIR